MALCHVELFGESIDKMTGLTLVLPDAPGPFGVVVLLHGLSDDHTVWSRRTSIERYADAHGLIVVMPDGGRSFYCNDPRPGGRAYEDHIVRDVIGFVDRTFPTRREAAWRGIAGLSMGGYGAVMLALRHPDLFCAAASHSGAMAFVRVEPESHEDVALLGRALAPQEYDCFVLAERRLADKRLPALRIDCGTEDFLLESNRAFHTHLDELGIEHIYEEYPGEHTWAYWDAHVPKTLAFLAEQMGP